MQAADDLDVMADLVSKVLAGGLSAGLFLLWWPSVVPDQGNQWLFVRGLLWTLAFEMLLLAFRPLERSVARAVSDREPAAVAPRRLAPLLAVAAIAAGIPLAMLAGAHAPVAAPARAAAPRVVVRREIVRREVVVRRVSRVVRVPAATPAVVPARAVAAAARAKGKAAATGAGRPRTPAPTATAGTPEHRTPRAPQTVPAPTDATAPAAAPAAGSAAPAVTAPSAAPTRAPTGAAQPTTTADAPPS